MTDCFIMIHVIIFFVGVTNMPSGHPSESWCVWRPCGGWLLGSQRSALLGGEARGQGCLRGGFVFAGRRVGGTGARGHSPICMATATSEPRTWASCHAQPGPSSESSCRRLAGAGRQVAAAWQGRAGLVPPTCGHCCRQLKVVSKWSRKPNFHRF